MRQIILDTETTGIGHDKGHKIIEIGCLELVNRQLTGGNFHVYINPERAVDPGAFRVHGISNEFLQDKPLFKDIVQDLLQFIEGAELVIHNAPFDIGFLNAELDHLQWGRSIEGYCSVLDTLALAKQKHPGQRNSLDALCKRYSIDNTNRTLHGALLDADLLARVYLAMTGGQGSLFADTDFAAQVNHSKKQDTVALQLNKAIVIRADEQEVQRHRDFVEGLAKKTKVPYWEELVE